MPNTNNLGLSLFDKSKESEVYFENWSRKINGNGDGSTDNPLSDMQKIDAEFKRLYGTSGTIEILTSSWNTATRTYSVNVSDMNNNDAILLTPSDINSKKALEEAGCFVSSNNNTVTFTVDKVPTSNLTLTFRILRGASV